ncbi:hypothetical protein KW783_01470 [Candidatus Parcubacteria bacterium]|nr:hypothetical protein [Candidatus Parcubacteria bacterium]
MISKERLLNLYVDQKKSSSEIAHIFKCSLNQVNYWLIKYKIKKRTISQALYNKHNPKGDPFEYVYPKTFKDALLFGLGMGLYWGEGNKRNKNSVRLTNGDPKMIKKFIIFLKTIFNIDKNKLKFGLQVFKDTAPSKALAFWRRELAEPKSKFQKVVILPSRGIGTYKHKLEYGVLTIYFNNTKLRDTLCNLMETI